MKNPVICAIDTADMVRAQELATAVKGQVAAVKLGLEFFVANGPDGVAQMAEAGTPVFLDLKFHDIPNTVAGAVRSALKLNPFMLTLHASGGRDMVKAAVDEVNKAGSDTILLGVTVLTSMNEADLRNLGMDGSVEDRVKGLVEATRSLPDNKGLDGFVCSPHEVAMLRKAFGKDIILVTPGVRPKNSTNSDQKRVMTPAQAIKAGANYLVIGRPITQSPDPAQAVKEILAIL